MTEGAVAGGDPEVVVALSAVGGGLAALAIDDFGTGHSSLARLDKLPVNVLKLDRDLVQRVSRPETRAIIAAIAQMAHALQMSVIAEGVEDGSTLALVKEIGCDAVQGHFLSEPIPPERVPDYLRSHGVEPGPG